MLIFKKQNVLYLLLSLMVVGLNGYSQEKNTVDPYHRASNGFGHLIDSNDNCSVWWAEGAYKVMRDAPVPEQVGDTIKIWSAQNEYESFLVVVKPNQRLENFRLTVSSLTKEDGSKVEAEQVSIRKVDYVKVTKPTDDYSFPGWWPDPLPLVDGPVTLFGAENQPFWVTIKTPDGTPSGTYHGTLTLSAEGWNTSIPVQLNVWDFALPEVTSMRSGFGLNMNTVNEYHQLTDPEDSKKVFDLYMQEFKKYKVAPYNPFEFSPIKETVSGIFWQGGFFDSKEKYAGKYAYKVEDQSRSEDSYAESKFIGVSDSPFQLSWWAKTQDKEQQFCVKVACYNAEKELLVYENRMEEFTGDDTWKTYSLNLGKLSHETRFVKVFLYPAFHSYTGEYMGTCWFDEVKLEDGNEKNHLFAGNFEVDLEKINIDLDFTDFDQAGERYLDEFGFNGFRLALKGMGSGTYYDRTPGVFEGFEQGTVEYEKLMQRYLVQIQQHLEEKGWLGKEYIYWFDEPDAKDYPFVRQGNEMIKKYAPKLTTFLTEHVAGQDLSDVTDISCTIWHKLDHEKARKLNERGLEYWTYLCCWPKSPWISEFIDHDAVNLRMWVWASWKFQFKGILIWSTNFWNSRSASPKDYLQNPWDEPMSFVTGYGWPQGKQTIWGNGDGRFFYPPNKQPNVKSEAWIEGPVPSLRLEILRDGLEDYDYLVLLKKAIEQASGKRKKLAKEAEQLLELPVGIISDEKTYSKNPKDLLEYRRKLARYIELLQVN
ncbi:glycoside hydrolase domain-containing protein [Sunxiuqinia sp. sy24]|uniref:glycoside hydrolase domain-containing protein n=1 Tax=Sunxiuqinia sp. sy24 TaxID=3461495 RepID=UPI0040453271